MASGHSIDGLIRYAKRDEWRDDFQAILDEFTQAPLADHRLSFEDIARVLGSFHVTNLWGAAFEELVTRVGVTGRNIVDEYLRRKGFAESVHTKRYAAAMRDATLSIYEVSDVVPGVSCLVRDLIRGGEPRRVFEKSGTQGLRPWTHLAARVVEVNGKTLFTGAILVLERRASETLVTSLTKGLGEQLAQIRPEMEKQLGPEGAAYIDQLLPGEFPRHLLAPLIVRTWLGDALTSCLEPMRFINSDGDSAVISETTYRFVQGRTRDDVRGALALCETLEQTDLDSFEWTVPVAKPLTRENRSGKTVVLTASREDGRQMIASIAIDADRLVVSTNSRSRRDRMEATLKPVLHGLAEPPTTVETSANDYVAELQSRPADERREKRESKQSTAISPAEHARIQREFMDRHYREILDKTVKVLGDRTPRAAAKAPASQESVVTWLKDMENSPMANLPDGSVYDFRWVWSELGLERLRV